MLADAVCKNNAPGKVIDKHAVAVSFSRAAHSYDRVANIQRWVIDELLKSVCSASAKGNVLDIGCGTGHLTLQFVEQFEPASVVGLDIAEGMVKVAQEKFIQHDLANSLQCTAICGDAEDLAFSSDNFDVVVSSFALQWCPNLDVVFKEVYRSLKKGGRFYFAMPIDSTLEELKNCWQKVDPNNTHVNEFYSYDLINAYAINAGFTQKNITVDRYLEHYPDLKSLTGALKSMGAHNVTTGRAKQLTGKEKIKQLKHCYETYRTDQGIPATWEVAFGVLEK